MPETALNDIHQAQRERLSHIDFRLRFLGTVGRYDLVRRFDIKEAAATRDLSLYRDLAPKNLEYDTKTRVYRYTDCFVPLFEYPAQQALTALAYGFGDDFVGRQVAPVACETPTRLNTPQLDSLSVLTRAIHQTQVVRMTYRSLSSGKTERDIVPFALIDNGLRWHIRAFDRLRNSFLDFVLNRISDPKVLRGELIQDNETRAHDIQWNRIVEMEIVPHPQVLYPETIAHEYNMVSGILRLNVRAAVAGYVLRRWNVDCSADHRLKGTEYQLWLRNNQALYGVENLVIAPGYRRNEDD